MTDQQQKYPLLAAPNIRLVGTVDDAMYSSFRQQLLNVPEKSVIVVALTTLGGDPEIARAMGDDIRLLRELHGRDCLFLGKVAVYSAGATFMSAFPVENRFLTKKSRIMIHERQMTKTVELSGPLRTCVASLKATLHEIEQSIVIQEEGFQDLVAGSSIDFEDLKCKALENWYIEAEEARDLGLILDIL